MRVEQFQTTLAQRGRWRDLLTLGSMVILGAVWAIFFFWAVLTTESWVQWWQTQVLQLPTGAWQSGVQSFLSSDVSLYAPPAILLLTSLLLFFYRVPRVQDRLTVPIEFALATLAFLCTNFVVQQLLQWLVKPALAASPAVVLRPAIALSHLELVVTLGLLAILFWLQASGRFRRYGRQLRRTIRQQARRVA
jgi:hypothetical protein